MRHFHFPHDRGHDLLTGTNAVPRTPNRKDTIISFNYDCVLEKAANDLHLKVSYGLDGYAQPNGPVPFLGVGNEGVRLLRLHGSVNWATSGPTQESVRIYPQYPGVVDGEAPLLVPPSWQKTFGSPLGKVWDAAVDALATATRIIV
jgi:hypothetical protein